MDRKALVSKWSQQQKVGTDGFVRLVDVMGDDTSIVQAARTSYGKGTKTVLSDRGLIRYLFRHWHSTPVEMCEIKLHVRVPIDIWRQWIRHRTASVNEYSTRYSEAIDSQNTTSPHEWRAQSKTNKQGSEGFLSNEHPTHIGEYLTDLETDAIARSKEAYNEALRLGAAREQARKNLPMSTYTEAYWKIDLHNLFHFLRLRLDLHAQQEIREFGQAIANIVKDWVPMAYEAFEDYRLGAVQFSRQELEVLRQWMQNSQINEYRWEDPDEEDCNLVDLDNLSTEARKQWLSPIESHRERKEFWNKIMNL